MTVIPSKFGEFEAILTDENLSASKEFTNKRQDAIKDDFTGQFLGQFAQDFGGFGFNH